MRRTKLPSIGEALRKIRSNKYHFFFFFPPLLKNFLPNTVIFVRIITPTLKILTIPSLLLSRRISKKKRVKFFHHAIRWRRQLGEILNEIRKHFDT